MAVNGPIFKSGARITGNYLGEVTVNEANAVAVTDNRVTADTVIIFTLKTVGGAPAGAPYVSSITPGTGFEVKAAAGDTSDYNYMLIN